ncbi:hypothetical protein B9479_002485 [Cryptococcus floricola]|uniref:Uncharacterized protein n=1 Tax=Cryptococcus floricola TaxID=2591691 RepID=A0A5D3B2A5_9TREE|nr:hypothetical protein B9479_002485 [Cryptococcus floricola]
MSSADQQTSTAPSSLNDTHQSVEDVSSEINTAVEALVNNFEFQLEYNITEIDNFKRFEHVFHSARKSILSAVKDEVTKTLKSQVASRKREGRTDGSMNDVNLYARNVDVDEGMRVHFEDFSVYGKGWSGKQTCTTLVIDSGLAPEGDSQKKEEEVEEQVV